MLRTRVNWTPLHDLNQVASLIDRAFTSPEPNNERHALPVDVLETNGNLIFRAAVPGVKPEEISITIEGGVLTIIGEYHFNSTDQDAKVYRLENRYGAFTRSLKLPNELALDKVDAEFANGLVTITIPRIEPVKPEALKVPIRTAQVIEAAPVTE